MNESTPSSSLGAIISNLVGACRFIYSTYVLALLVVGATQVALTSLGITNPDWLVATLAVLGYLGVPVAGLAVANTSKKVAAAELTARRRARGTAGVAARRRLNPADHASYPWLPAGRSRLPDRFPRRRCSTQPPQ